MVMGDHGTYKEALKEGIDIVVLYRRVRRGGGNGGGVGKIVKYGEMSNDRSSDKR